MHAEANVNDVNEESNSSLVQACAHRYVQKGADFQWGQGICYSLTQYLDYQRAWEPCYNRPVDKAHEQYGYCQAGTSADISEDNDIVIGTPGPYTWRGTIFTNSIRFGMRDDKIWYSGPLVEGASPVEKYSYLGEHLIPSVKNVLTADFVHASLRNERYVRQIFW